MKLTTGVDFTKLQKVAGAKKNWFNHGKQTAKNKFLEIYFKDFFLNKLTILCDENSEFQSTLFKSNFGSLLNQCFGRNQKLEPCRNQFRFQVLISAGNRTEPNFGRPPVKIVCSYFFYCSIVVVNLYFDSLV